MPEQPQRGQSQLPLPVEPLLVRVEEAARILSLSRSTIYGMLDAGELPSVRRGGTEYNHANLHRSFKGHLLSEGVPLKTVGDILGHSQISITADYYGHISPKAQRAGLETVKGFVE